MSRKQGKATAVSELSKTFSRASIGPTDEGNNYDSNNRNHDDGDNDITASATYKPNGKQRARRRKNQPDDHEADLQFSPSPRKSEL